MSASRRTFQFEYAWLRVLSGRYADFWQVTEDALALPDAVGRDLSDLVVFVDRLHAAGGR